MNDGGYTLVEMLAALAILGLAFGGLSESAGVLGRMQLRATADARGLALEDRGVSQLGHLLEAAGPFPASGGFVGEPSEFEFQVGAETCHASLKEISGVDMLATGCGGSAAVSTVPAGAEFRYGDASGLASTWPPADDPSLILKSVSLVDTRGGGRPLATAQLTVDQPATCVFDVVAQACRGTP